MVGLLWAAAEFVSMLLTNEAAVAIRVLIDGIAAVGSCCGTKGSIIKGMLLEVAAAP